MFDSSFFSYLNYILIEKWYENLFLKLSLNRKLLWYFVLICFWCWGGYVCYIILIFVINKGNKILKM